MNTCMVLTHRPIHSLTMSPGKACPGQSPSISVSTVLVDVPISPPPIVCQCVSAAATAPLQPQADTISDRVQLSLRSTVIIDDSQHNWVDNDSASWQPAACSGSSLYDPIHPPAVHDVTMPRRHMTLRTAPCHTHSLLDVAAAKRVATSGHRAGLLHSVTNICCTVLLPPVPISPAERLRGPLR